MNAAGRGALVAHLAERGKLSLEDALSAASALVTAGLDSQANAVFTGVGGVVDVDVSLVPASMRRKVKNALVRGEKSAASAAAAAAAAAA
eukprot:CAMPEP_0170145118 /NCGR_PEP_ID=MMETSP0033_2-20121228/16346_1 /TAXON_ID=195969 /ORGANISM="Dolichomastix tenuilepis, Strain CCMP3274" /LENGTH=89 /DNA_ID=CAMNT_0010381655 /DNA_START=6 /DNA_END=272 /DNA_ORIENTATION=+